MRRVQVGVASSCNWKLCRFQASLSLCEFQHAIELYFEEIGGKLGNLEEVRLPRPSWAPSSAPDAMQPYLFALYAMQHLGDPISAKKTTV